MEYKPSPRNSQIHDPLSSGRLMLVAMPLLSLFLVIGLSLSSIESNAAVYDLCARGVGQFMSKTSHVQIVIQGPEIGTSADALFPEIIKAKLWNGKAESVFVESYDTELCSAALGGMESITLNITVDEAKAFRSGSVRGTNRVGKILAGRGKVSKTLPRPELTEDEQYYSVSVSYATNRTPEKRSGEMGFGSNRGQGLSFGTVDVTIPADHRLGDLETPSIFRLWKPTPGKDFAVQTVIALDHATWRSEIRKRAISFGTPGVLIFVPGYNVTFNDAALRAAQLTYDLSFEGRTVLFSWPSNGEIAQYLADQDAAEESVQYLKELLKDLSDLGGGVPLYIVAHSMGNRVLLKALKELFDEDRTSRRPFKEIVLAAPDVNANLFKNDIAPRIVGLGPRVTLYASSRDIALAASRNAHGGYDRLGESGDRITIMPNLDTVDASAVQTDFWGHSYYGNNCSVLADIFYLIRGKLGPEKRLLQAMTSPTGNYWKIKH